MNFDNISRRGVLKGTAALTVGSALPMSRAFAADTTVGFIYVGSRDDYGYNQAHAAGAAALKKMPGIKVVEEEKVPETDAVEKTMESMINLDGATLLFPTSFGYYNPHMIKMAQKFPKLRFEHCGGLWSEKDPKNAGSYFGYIDEAQHVAGIIAGYSSKSGKLGFVAAKPIPQVLRNINAWTLGAKLANPKITTQVIFTGDWSMPVKEAEATNSLIDQGVDVITCHVDGPKTVVENAARRGAMVTGYHVNQSVLAPKAYLTGAEWNWEVLYPRFVKMFTSGETIPNFYRGGLKEEIVKVSPYGDMVSAEAKAKADEVKAALTAGSYVIFKGRDGRCGRRIARPDRSRTREDELPRRRRHRSDFVKADVGAPVGTPVVKTGAGEFLRLPPITAKTGGAAEYVVIPAGALLASLVLFGIFVALFGKNPLDLYFYMYQGAFGTWFSWQNTLTRAAPLILTALCTALPAQLGMVIIGGEGALLIGALCATSAALAMAGAPPLVVDTAMAVAGMIGGGLWIMLSGALRQYRGVNETISSLLLVYIALAILNFLVEGPMRDPTSLNKPSTPEIGTANMIGSIPGTDVHWGFMFGVIAAVLSYILIYHTVFGFAARVAGGNLRAARVVGLSVGKLILIVCFLAGAAAGLAGMFEVAAVQGRTNANLAAGYGFAGILVAFLARQNPLAVIPVAILLGGIGASGGLLQRRLGLPDASVLVLEGMIFVMVLASDTLYGRLSIFRAKGA
jgi:basic membrane protein A and related proteins